VVGVSVKVSVGDSVIVAVFVKVPVGVSAIVGAIVIGPEILLAAVPAIVAFCVMIYIFKRVVAKHMEKYRELMDSARSRAKRSLPCSWMWTGAGGSSRAGITGTPRARSS